MKYRIKVIEKYNGEKEFVPQLRDGAFELKNLFGVLLFPFLLLFAMAHPDWGLYVFDEFFINWKGIEYNKIDHKDCMRCFLNNGETANCQTQEEAEVIIKIHQKSRQDEIIKKLEEDKKKRANRTMKTTYIKI